MFKVAVGHSIDPDSEVAIQEAIAQCQQALQGTLPQAAILLSAIDFEHQVILDYIQTVFPGLAVIGGTTVGEMSSEKAFQQDSLMLMLLCSDTVILRAGLGQGISQDAIAAAQAAIPVQQGLPPRLCYALGEGLGVDGVAIVDGLQAVLGDEVPIFGGLTADDWRFEETYQFFGTQVLRDAVVTLTFFGDLHLSYGVATGQHPIGQPGIVTKSKDNTLHEVDHESVKAFYHRYFKNGSTQTPMKVAGGSWGGALAVFEAEEQNFYLRSPNRQDEGTGSVDYFGRIPEQVKVQFTETSTKDLLQAADEAVTQAYTAYPGQHPSAALIVSCSSRMKTLGTRAEEEYKIAQSKLGTLPVIGFHAYGEICPLEVAGKSRFHNETFTALFLGTE